MSGVEDKVEKVAVKDVNEKKLLAERLKWQLESAKRHLSEQKSQLKDTKANFDTELVRRNAEYATLFDQWDQSQRDLNRIYTLSEQATALE